MCLYLLQQQVNASWQSGIPMMIVMSVIFVGSSKTKGVAIGHCLLANLLNGKYPWPIK